MTIKSTTISILSISIWQMLTLSHPSFGQPKSWTLDQLQDSAIINYPLIKQYDLINQAEEYTVSNAGKSYLPHFDVSLIGGLINGAPSQDQSSSTDANLITILQLNQTIWDGGLTKTQKNIAKTNADLQRAELEVSIYSVRQKVNDLFFGILLIEEQIKQLVILQENLQTNLKLIETRVTNGTAYKSDLDEIKVELINSDQKKTELIYAKRAYKKMLSLMIGTELSDDSILERPESNSIKSTDINRPELEVFNHQSQLIDHQNQLNKAQLYPKVGLIGFGTFIQPGINFGPNSINNILVAGLNVSWNISALYKNKNNNSLSAVNRQMLLVQEETFRYQTNLQISRTQQEISKYQELIKRDQEILNLKKSIRSSYETKYKNGVATLSQLLSRINDENVATQNMILHDIQYLMALHQLKTETGN